MDSYTEMPEISNFCTKYSFLYVTQRGKNVSGERGGQEIDPSCTIHRPGKKFRPEIPEPPGKSAEERHLAERKVQLKLDYLRDRNSCIISM